MIDMVKEFRLYRRGLPAPAGSAPMIKFTKKLK